MKITAFSDNHGFLGSELIAPCDVLLIAGDFVPLNIQRAHDKCWKWMRDEFLPFLKDYPCKQVYFIGGNHDFFLDTPKALSKLQIELIKANLSNKVHYLLDSGIEYEGKWFYGTPYMSMEKWAFYSDHCADHYKGIPDCDVLLTHCPINGPVGTSYWDEPNPFSNDWGSKELFDCLKGRNIKWHVCGHVHQGDHSCPDYNGTKVANVSVLGENYRFRYFPLEFEI